MQKVGAKSQHAGAASAFCHVLQLIQHKAQLDAGDKILQLCGDLCRFQPFGGPLGGPQHQITLSSADVLAVDDGHVFVLTRRQTSVLVAGG